MKAPKGLSALAIEGFWAGITAAVEKRKVHRLRLRDGGKIKPADVAAFAQARGWQFEEKEGEILLAA